MPAKIASDFCSKRNYGEMANFCLQLKNRFRFRNKMNFCSDIFFCSGILNRVRMLRWNSGDSYLKISVKRMGCCPSTENVRALTSERASLLRAQVDYASQLTQLHKHFIRFAAFTVANRSFRFLPRYFSSVCSSWEKITHCHCCDCHALAVILRHIEYSSQREFEHNYFFLLSCLFLIQFSYILMHCDCERYPIWAICAATLTLRLLYGRSIINLAAIDKSPTSAWPVDADDDGGGGNDVSETDCFIGLVDVFCFLSVVGEPIFSFLLLLRFREIGFAIFSLCSVYFVLVDNVWVFLLEWVCGTITFVLDFDSTFVVCCVLTFLLGSLSLCTI